MSKVSDFSVINADRRLHHAHDQPAMSVLLIALRLKKTGQLNETLQTFDQDDETLLGLDAHLVEQLDDSLLLEKLTFLGQLDIDHCWVWLIFP